jgi:multidrug resistance efflux pump
VVRIVSAILNQHTASAIESPEFPRDTRDRAAVAWQPLEAKHIIANFMHSNQTTDAGGRKTPAEPLTEDQATEPLPRIRTPFRMMWREVRIRLLPPVVFAGVLGASYVLWQYVGDGSTVPGVGEGVRSTVASPQLGLLVEVYVEPFEWVEAGDPLAVLVPVDPQAKLDLLQSDLQIARLRLEPSIPERNALNYERIRVEWLRLKQDLAVAEVNLARAENFLRRNEALVKDKLVSEDAYDLSLKERDLYKAEIAAKSAAFADIEGRLIHLRGLGEVESPGTNQAMINLIARLEARMTAVETNWAPRTLHAPISGMVNMVYRRQNEYVVEGEPLITINSPRSERVVAYLHQPYLVEPEVGLAAEILTRNRKRQRFTSRIAEVGAQVETITNSLAFIRTGALVDEGLPIVLEVPPNVHIRPGEIVDVVLKPISSAARESDGSERASIQPNKVLK